MNQQRSVALVGGAGRRPGAGHDRCSPTRCPRASCSRAPCSGRPPACSPSASCSPTARPASSTSPTAPWAASAAAWPPPSPRARGGTGARRRSSAWRPAWSSARSSSGSSSGASPTPRASCSPWPRSAWPSCSAASPSTCRRWLDVAGVHPAGRDLAHRLDLQRRPGHLHRQRPAAAGRGARSCWPCCRGSCCGTEAGMAVRGMAENMDRARLLGIPVNQLSLLLWSVAGGLAALTVVLRAPTEGVPLTAVAGPTVLLPALAAAVIVGMRSMSGRLRGRRAPRRPRPARAVERRQRRADVGRAARRHRRRPAAAAAVGPPGRARASRRGRWSASATGSREAYAQLPEVRTAKIVLAGLVVVGGGAGAARARVRLAGQLRHDHPRLRPRRRCPSWC